VAVAPHGATLKLTLNVNVSAMYPGTVFPPALRVPRVSSSIQSMAHQPARGFGLGLGLEYI
jgi:hypothetical protein